MIYDTDILIWIQRGNRKALDLIQNDPDLNISIFTYMELQQATKNKANLKVIKRFIKEADFAILPLTPEIGHGASIYVEEYTLGHAVRAGDALIAATAIENNQPLCSGNTQHFKAIKELKLQPFKP